MRLFPPLNGTEHGSQPSLNTRDRELVSVLEVRIEPGDLNPRPLTPQSVTQPTIQRAGLTIIYNTNLVPWNHPPSKLVFNNDAKYNLYDASSVKDDNPRYFSGGTCFAFIQLAACKTSYHSSCQKLFFPDFAWSVTYEIFCFYHREVESVVLLVFFSAVFYVKYFFFPPEYTNTRTLINNFLLWPA